MIRRCWLVSQNAAAMPTIDTMRSLPACTTDEKARSQVISGFGSCETICLPRSNHRHEGGTARTEGRWLQPSVSLSNRYSPAANK